MDSKYIKTEKKNGITTILLNRPDAMNALNTPMLQGLKNCLAGLEGDVDTKVVVIRGDAHFCAGADIKELQGKSPEEAEVFSRLGHSVMKQIEALEKPVIAAVSGYALGGGCEIILACDMRVAGESARFGQPEINIGVIPGFGAAERLPRLVGIGKAKEMIMTGMIIDARQAASIGLVNRVARDEELFGKAEELAGTLSKKSPSVLKRIKSLMNRRFDSERGFDPEIVSFSECFATEDFREGMKAFLEKRKPDFRGI